MAKKAPPEKPKDQKAQSEKFVKKARELGADESGEAFERTFKKAVPAKKPNRKNPS